MAEKKTTTKKVAKKAAPKKTTTKKVVKKTTTKKTVTKKTSVKKAPTKKTVTKKAVSTKKTVAKRTPVKKVVKKQNSAKKSVEMGVWSRFWRVFTPSFLKKLSSEESTGKSWGFWFLSNFLLAFVPVIIGVLFINFSFFSNFPESMIKNIPNDAEITLDNGQSYNLKNILNNFELKLYASGKLVTKNIPDPLVIKVSQTRPQNDELFFYTTLDNLSLKGSDGVVVLDTKQELIDPDNFPRNFSNFTYFLKDRFITSDPKTQEIKEIPYKALIADKEVSKFPLIFNKESLKDMAPFLKTFLVATLIGIGTFLFFFFAILRLINVVFWALVFWLIGAIVRVKDWNFDKSFRALLHFSFISMLFVPLAFIFDISVFWYAFAVFGIFFGMNFWEMKTVK